MKPRLAILTGILAILLVALLALLVWDAVPPDSRVRTKEPRISRPLVPLHESRYFAQDTRNLQRIIGLAGTRRILSKVEGGPEWLERAAAPDRSESSSGEDNERAIAIESLAAYFEQEGRWEEALACWKGLSSWSWCGTCAAGRSNLRMAHIALCLGKLGRVEETLLAECEDWILKGHSRVSFNKELVQVVVDLHRKRGSLDSFEDRIRAFRREQETTVETDLALELIDLVHLARKKNYGELLRYYRWDGEDEVTDAKARLAGDLILEAREVTRPFLLKEARGDVLDMQACRLLGEMRAPGLVPIVKDKLLQPENWLWFWPYFRALSLLDTPEAHAVIRRYAGSPDPQKREAALRFLKKHPPPSG